MVMGQGAAGEPGRDGPVEERLRKRERVLGWALFGLFLVGLVGLGGLLLLALPLIVIAFPLTLSAIAALLMIAWWRRRRPG